MLQSSCGYAEKVVRQGFVLAHVNEALPAIFRRAGVLGNVADKTKQKFVKKEVIWRSHLALMSGN